MHLKGVQRRAKGTENGAGTVKVTVGTVAGGDGA